MGPENSHTVSKTREFLDHCRDQKEEIIARIVTENETWVHRYEPNSEERGVFVTGKYCASLLDRLRGAIKEKRIGKLTNGVLLLHDNAPVHENHIVTFALHRCGLEQLRHPHHPIVQN
ncbi:unnamed protein product [Euphydryas editha]|uniref:Transposase n=1 Tax=Euphydryas editha TaxID=104508 RepID=A0AAU9USY2_EUPED|nr:unnamed protein product [Euphydryas editha]